MPSESSFRSGSQLLWCRTISSRLLSSLLVAWGCVVALACAVAVVSDAIELGLLSRLPAVQGSNEVMASQTILPRPSSWLVVDLDCVPVQQSTGPSKLRSQLCSIVGMQACLLTCGVEWCCAGCILVFVCQRQTIWGLIRGRQARKEFVARREGRSVGRSRMDVSMHFGKAQLSPPIADLGTGVVTDAGTLPGGNSLTITSFPLLCLFQPTKGSRVKSWLGIEVHATECQLMVLVLSMIQASSHEFPGYRRQVALPPDMSISPERSKLSMPCCP